MPSRYETNTYGWLKRKGLAPKYEHAGIYCIKIDDDIVYIGKSQNMLMRVAQHYVGIKTESSKKYRILAEVQRKGHRIGFDVLYRATQTRYTAVEQEIGEKEGEFIRKHKPILNTQIPKAEDWTKYDFNEVDAKQIINDLLTGENNDY